MKLTVTHSLEVLGIGGVLQQSPPPFRMLSEKCRRGKIIHSPPVLSAVSVNGSKTVQLQEGLSWTCRSSVQGLESRKFCYEDGSTVFFWDTMAGVRRRPAKKIGERG